MKIPVMFRMCNGDVIAVFTDKDQMPAKPSHRVIYAGIGEHSEAPLHAIKTWRAAKATRYQGLLTFLRSVYDKNGDSLYVAYRLREKAKINRPGPKVERIVRDYDVLAIGECVRDLLIIKKRLRVARAVHAMKAVNAAIISTRSAERHAALVLGRKASGSSGMASFAALKPPDVPACP